ncbi:hypothetical protein C2G38_2259711 [Gigaspora rosea]|uniref:Uncharacterized protein n=1 Tax=Gigaspora rosea TaxID=44941 RepID=A0A397UNX1_9GLOM|nr:hypothetical protein C2G38_2259711 [Gigaspora rosea]
MKKDIQLKLLQDIIDIPTCQTEEEICLDSSIPILYLTSDLQTLSTLKKSPLAPVKNLLSIKPCPKNRSKKSQDTRNKEETEYLSLYVQINASEKKSCLPKVCTPKPSSTKPGLKRPKEHRPVNRGDRYRNDIDTSKNETSGTENENKTYPYCQQSAEINEPESDQKMNEEIINDLAIPEEIVEDKALEKNDREILIKVEDGRNERKNSDQLTKPLDGKTLNHACERWLEWVKDFRMTCKWYKTHKIKESLTTESIKEIASVNNCNRAEIRDKKGSRVGFEDKKCKLLLHAQKSAEIGHMGGMNNSYEKRKTIKSQKNGHDYESMEVITAMRESGRINRKHETETRKTKKK